MNINTMNKQKKIQQLRDLILEKRKNFGKNIYSNSFKINNVINMLIILDLQKYNLNIKHIINNIKKISEHTLEIVNILLKLIFIIIFGILRYIINALKEYYLNNLICDCEDFTKPKKSLNIIEKYKNLKSLLKFKLCSNNFLFKILQSVVTLLTVGMAGVMCMEENYIRFNS